MTKIDIIIWLWLLAVTSLNVSGSYRRVWIGFLNSYSMMGQNASATKRK